MLDINLEFYKGMLFVRLSGVLNINTCTKLSKCLDNMINGKGLRYFVINLEELDYVDDKGLQAIIDRYFDIVMHDGRLVVCGYNNRLNSVKINNIFKQIEHTNTELNALKLINI